jgi:ribosomal subunit interface protein
MVVSYTAKHVEIDNEMKDYLEKKLQKVKFYFKQIININVMIGQERGQITTDVKVSASQDVYFAKETASTWKESFDNVIDKVEKEIKKKKDKITDHHK